MKLILPKGASVTVKQINNFIVKKKIKANKVT